MNGDINAILLTYKVREPKWLPSFNVTGAIFSLRELWLPCSRVFVFIEVNFWLLFQKLLPRNVPLFIVRILAMWYTHQKMCIRWNNAISPFFFLSTDVLNRNIDATIQTFYRKCTEFDLTFLCYLVTLNQN